MANHLLTRRQAVGRWLAATSIGIAARTLWLSYPAQAQVLPETPSCGPDDGATISQTEGPFYTPHSPAKRNFRADAPGAAFTLIGFVTNKRCRPIANAVVDLWHADASGAYDNSGFRLRGHQATDALGRYVFETIVPGMYPGRTRHFHVKVAVPGQRVLTTQLYFPGDARANSGDSIFDHRLLMRVDNASDGKIGRYDFVVNVA
ncbi:intradiol ring-cleavage dioxygenase [Bradyrhizobium erythrophlei]|uniref:dioxygenase family protein n=1 Tax=Bradyrhizobium erythrophlei TaxID=1437360 RepID=UPI0035E73ACD